VLAAKPARRPRAGGVGPDAKLRAKAEAAAQEHGRILDHGAEAHLRQLVHVKGLVAAPLAIAWGLQRCDCAPKPERVRDCLRIRDATDNCGSRRKKYQRRMTVRPVERWHVEVRVAQIGTFAVIISSRDTVLGLGAARAAVERAHVPGADLALGQEF
jgi:hypothetical protein